MNTFFRFFVGLLAFGYSVAQAQSSSSPRPAETEADWRARARQETARPLQPGLPGERAFWSDYAMQFQYAPAFNFHEVAGAKSYRFTLLPTHGDAIVFMGEKPWAPMSAAWTELVPGTTTLTVQGLDAQGAAVGSPMTRVFHRAAPFGQHAYPPATLSWAESAHTALDAVVHSPDLRCWFTTGEPDEKFALYRYPADNVGAAAALLALYAAQTPAPADAAEALQAARRAADHLIGISFPADFAWAFHPPTYHPALFRKELTGHTTPDHYFTISGAQAGEHYLTVYAATKDPKYLAAATRIAETFAHRQLANGSWDLFVTQRDGQPITNNALIPIRVVGFLERLARASGDHRFDAARDRAVAWIMENPARTWNWQSQCQDVKPAPPYQNMTEYEAGYFAAYLLQTSAGDRVHQALALELIRFSEDQFVQWEELPDDTKVKRHRPVGQVGPRSDRWLVPSVAEQYACYTPVCAGSATMIRAYLAAYRVTGDRLPLAKARALAATLTRTQANENAPGRYQTWVMPSPGFMWINCELRAIAAMQELAQIDPAEAALLEPSRKPAQP